MRDQRKTSWNDVTSGMSRRDIILSGVLGGSALLAGCLGDDNGNGDDGLDPEQDLEDIEGVHVEGQSLVIATDDNPEEMSFLWDMTADIDTVYETSTQVQQATNELGLWGNYDTDDPDELVPMLYEDIDVGVEEMTITIRDDAYWSDGEPVTAFDGVASRAFHSTFILPPTVGWTPDPDQASPTAAVIGATMPEGPDGKVWKWELQDRDVWRDIGGFQGIWNQIAQWVGGFNPRLGVQFPTHIQPYKDIAEHAWDEWQDLDEDHLTQAELIDEYASEADIERLRQGHPEYVSHGAWTVDEIRGTENVVLKPNEHHRHYDRLNFDEVVLDWVEEDHRLVAGLQGRQLDYGIVTVSPEAVESFPDSITEVTAPAWNGYVLGVDHSSPFGDVRVRQAMMYAIDADLVAQNTHPTAAHPLHVPGADNWNMREILGDDWVEENLIDYSQDLDRAEELMIEAGFERGADDVWQRDGQPLETQLATDADVINFEETVAQHLSDFGILIQPQTYDSATFTDRYFGSEDPSYIDEEYGGTGDFELWANDIPGGTLAAGTSQGLLGFWWTAFNQRPLVRARNLFDHDAQEHSLSEDHGDTGYVGDPGWVGGQVGLWEDWTIEIPPIGEPDGDLSEFNPAYTQGLVDQGLEVMSSPQEDNPYYDPPHDESHEENEQYFWRKFAWTLNWHLPVLPIALQSTQHFLNTENFIWPGAVDDDLHQRMWDEFGVGVTGTNHLLGMGRVLADPENPKDDAELVDTDD